MSLLVSYRLRNPEEPDEIYGDGIEDEEEAQRRARRLADFYGHPVEICRVTFGRYVHAGSLMEPGPTAPPPLADRTPPLRRQP